MKKLGWMWTSMLAAAAVIAVSALELWLAVRECGGEYIYPIDDAYIHLAMAKNLVGCGCWGVEEGKLAFCSSSPLWTLVLAAFTFVFGLHDILPWFLSLAFCVATLVIVDVYLHKRNADTWMRVVGMAAVAVAGPFFCTVALGMEHAMHTFFVVSAIMSVCEVHRLSWRRTIAACVLVAAATASRYESLFVFLPLGIGLCAYESFDLWRGGKRPLPVRSGLVLLSAGAPPLLYGLWAISQGGHFLPNSLLLKGKFMTLPELFHAMFKLFGSVAEGHGFLYLLGVSLLTVMLLPRTRRFWRLAAAAGIIAIGSQMLFASIGQLCRYEAFIASSSAFVVIAAVVSAGGIGSRPVAYIPLAVFALASYSLVDRAKAAFPEAVHSSSDIKHQQVLMTRLMSEMPEEDRGLVALNDLGYMAMHGNFPILDIWGLGSQSFTELLLKHPGTWHRADFVKAIPDCKVKYLVVFEKWYPRSLMPDNVIDVATLTLKDNVACGADTVVFRATSEDAANCLERHLKKYAGKLPSRVRLWFFR